MFKFISKFQGHGIEIARINSLHIAKPLIFFNIFCAINLEVTSSWAIVLFKLSVRIPY